MEFILQLDVLEMWKGRFIGRVPSMCSHLYKKLEFDSVSSAKLTRFAVHFEERERNPIGWKIEHFNAMQFRLKSKYSLCEIGISATRELIISILELFTRFVAHDENRNTDAFVKSTVVRSLFRRQLIRYF